MRESGVAMIPSSAIQTLPEQHPDGVPSFLFANTFARLPASFHARSNPSPASRPRLIQLNQKLAGTLGFDPIVLSAPEGVEILAGNRIAGGSEPLAIAYAGHQFGHFVPQLGDGRAHLLGELRGTDGVLYDLQLKGSGPTPFSRRGDGRAALGPVLREYLVSEAMSALGVPSTRALAAVRTGDSVYRETVQPGAVLARIASSHLRIGTFQFFAARGQVENLRILADYAIARHDPDLSEDPRRYRAFLERVITRQARLVAQWMLLGFVHGVMNTDNVAISGETLDFGPCAFLESYVPAMCFSSIDTQGRYAYNNQPHALHWNLCRLAEALLPLLTEEQGGEEGAVASAQEALLVFSREFETVYRTGLCRKIGLQRRGVRDDALVDDLLVGMAESQADFTLTFRRLADAAEKPAEDAQLRPLFSDPAAYDSWAPRWRQRLAQEPDVHRASRMRQINALFIPRNHLVQAVIEASVERGDDQPFRDLLEVVLRPYEDQPGREQYAAPAKPEQLVRQTFCGT